jgi:hypothetical protein
MTNEYAVFKLCGGEACPGILMPYEDTVLCSEVLAEMHREHDEGGDG